MRENLYFEFVDSLKDMLSKRFHFEVDIEKVTRNNGHECLGLAAMQTDGLHPVIPIDTYYREYLNGKRIEMICGTIYELLKKYSNQGNTQLTDFGKISDRIFLKLVNAEKNKDALLNMPHSLYHDLAVTYYLLLEEKTEADATLKITNSFLSVWNIEEKDLYELALENTRKHSGSVVESMDMVLGEVLGNFYSQDRDTYGRQEDDPLNAVYIVSNNRKKYGAAVILYENVLEEIAEMLQHDFFILPSSVHELIVLPVKPNDSRGQTLIQMVREVNELVVEEDDILSDNIYLYHIEGKFMEMIGYDN